MSYPMRFADLPHERRMSFREAAEPAMVQGYAGPYMALVMPRDNYEETCARLVEAGLVRATKAHCAPYFFPLGTDHYPDSHRWDGNYPGSRGFKLVECWGLPDGAGQPARLSPADRPDCDREARFP